MSNQNETNKMEIENEKQKEKGKEDPNVLNTQENKESNTNQNQKKNTATTEPKNEQPTEEQLQEMKEKQLLDFLERIQKTPYETVNWEHLMQQIKTVSLPIARKVYKIFFKYYPFAGKYWSQWAEQEISHKEFKKAEKIFSKSLLVSNSVAFWRSYLKYVQIAATIASNEAAKQFKKKTEEELATRNGVKVESLRYLLSNEELRINELKYQTEKNRIYEAMVTDSYKYAWRNFGRDIESGPIYSNYLTFVKSIKPDSDEERIRQVESLRRIYHNSISTPMTHVEMIWRDFTEFEKQQPDSTEENILHEYSRPYTHARMRYRERMKIMEQIDVKSLPVALKNTIEEVTQLQGWKELIKYEKTNPLNLRTTRIYHEISFVLNKSLTYMYHYPNIWIDATNFQIQNGYFNLAENIFKNALRLFPNLRIIAYSFAILLERQTKLNEAIAIYNKILQIEKTSLGIVQYIAFVRRNFGINRTRKAFLKLISDQNMSYHVYLYMAQIEANLNKNLGAAKRVLKLALKKYSRNVDFLIQIVEFYDSLALEKKIRKILKNACEQIKPPENYPLLKRYLEFERDYGNLRNVRLISKKIKSFFPNYIAVSTSLSLSKYGFQQLVPSTKKDYKLFKAASLNASNKPTQKQIFYKNPRIGKQKKSQFDRFKILEIEAGLSSKIQSNIEIQSESKSNILENRAQSAQLDIPPLTRFFLKILPPPTLFTVPPPPPEVVLQMIINTPINF
ncbi:RNA cleavage stimulation factor [Anaeramoeba flamelloides]|uniref:RNA cleavage stimulation factor n=1 Tax=Anaeramoeba flamelloides TaxID=1746091 RepID=A0ABQ8XZE1_9EUKA|nr:RNA cleavage stimulation factor [Anaeramoeba flamelloides]